LIPWNGEIEGCEKKHAEFDNMVSSTAEQMRKKLQELQNVFDGQLQEIKMKESKRLASAKKYLLAFLHTLAEAEKLMTIVLKR
jgi:flagellar biosynthesis/type III secretory pathway chaperone